MLQLLSSVRLQSAEYDYRTIPVYYDMNNVALSSDDRSVLISYENKVRIVFHENYIFFATHYTIMPYQSPSQFWQLQVDRSNTDFILRHSYMPKESTSFAALPSIFGGEEDHLILRAGTGQYSSLSPFPLPRA